MKITKVIAREIFDSRGFPTVQCEIFLDKDRSVIASVPAGMSLGSEEALEVRDGGKRLFGKGVLKAIENIETIIAPEILGKEPNAIDMDLKFIEMDGTPNKSYLGANSILAVSMAIYRAQAAAENLELYELIAHFMGANSVSLPFGMFNLINGGLHANNNLFIQEFMVVPVGAENFRAALENAILIYHELKAILHANGKSVAVGDEGGFAPNFKDDFEALEMLFEAINRVSSKYNTSAIIAIDVAASQYYNPKTKLYKLPFGQLSTIEMIEYYKSLVKKYPIYSIEDGLSELDWEGWIKLTASFESNAQIVADDIFATNVFKIARGINEGVANSVIIKPNQIGTVTESLQAIKLCKENNLNTIVSHRSGETEDSFIADLAVGSNAGQIKSGGCARSDRMAKYNRLLAIEDTLRLGQFDS